MFIADLHIHSRYSRATSRDCTPEMLDLWGRRKGLDLIGTGDFTHPAWREELQEKLLPAEDGLYMLKDDLCREDDIAGGHPRPRFMVTGEISSIYKKNGRVRKVHNLILLPSLESAEVLSRKLEAIGNLHSDGRPILGLDSRDLLEITLDACPEAIFIPAHIWTPHFSLFGAYSGFDTIEECFGDLTNHIHALETGLSSDPPMNWRLSALDRFTLVSNSDAHSPANLAREANLFDTVLSYPGVSQALQNRETKEFFGTVEFFPEEGKYHYDGHRNCKVCLKPSDTDAVSGICPVCGGRITVGVLHRVEALADRTEGFILPTAKHFENLVPLKEVIAASIGVSAASKKVGGLYDDLIRALGPELFILRDAELGDIDLTVGSLVAEGIRRLRAGKVEVQPGYDGEYGQVKIFEPGEVNRLGGQMCFFQEKQETPAPKELRGEKPLEKPIAESGATEIQTGENGTGNGAGIAQAVGPGNAFAELNRGQQEAVFASDPAVAVIAGPGTGKTRTLVSRIIHLVRDCGVSPAEITAVTFTNRAANEMRSRITAYFGDRRAVNAMSIGTFHSICLRILSGRNGGAAPVIIGEQDALSVLTDLLKDLGIKASSRDVLREISLMKSGAQSPEEAGEVPPRVYDRYCEQLAQYGVLDYDDILLNVLGLFEGGELENGEQEEYQRAFSYLLVDEFQDINPVQYRLIQAWGKHSAEIFVIGDPDQSIYGFRGSDSRCFDRLFVDFPKARQVRLTQNYRSTPEILGCALPILKKEDAEQPLLQPQRDSGVRVRLLEADGDLTEAIFVAKEIGRMVGGIDMLDTHTSSASKGKESVPEQTRSFSDIAVLYRTNHQAKLLEQCLQKEGIPYLVAGRDEFLSDREVRKTVAFFRFLLDPADLISLRLCLKEWEVCPSGRIQRMLKDYASTDKSAASLLKLVGETPSLSENAQKFSELLGKYEPLACREKPQKLIDAWIGDNGFQEVQSMELFSNIAVLHEDMPAFLQNLLLGQEGDLLRNGGRSYSSDAVSLMTLHAAKGLEFPVVFVCGVSDGMIPLKNRRGDCDPSEERRLFYVGMTRAQDELTLLTSSARSPFLAGLPTNLLSEGSAFKRKKAPEFEQVSFF